VTGERDITGLLMAWSRGDRQALDDLTPLVYEELRNLAKRHLRGERARHTIQGTALVHEAYLKLVDQKRVAWNHREHFFAVASRVMRQVLVSHARARRAAKRGSGQTLVSFDDSIALPEWRGVDIIALDDALETLCRMDPQQGRIVEMRFFSGLSIESTATLLGISPATVKRDWNVARAWLHRELSHRGAVHGA
jgi:RNA polymerase sigma factor (TIGR02999 family)